VVNNVAQTIRQIELFGKHLEELGAFFFIVGAPRHIDGVMEPNSQLHDDLPSHHEAHLVKDVEAVLDVGKRVVTPTFFAVASAQLLKHLFTDLCVGKTCILPHIDPSLFESFGLHVCLLGFEWKGNFTYFTPNPTKQANYVNFP